MGKIIIDARVSLDGFINDRNGSVECLYPDIEGLRETEAIQESIKTTGAVLMGRHTYDMAEGDFTGYEYQVPIYILTHRIPKKVAKGENGNFQFHFVMDGIESAIKQARTSAEDKNVTVVGGANIIQQCIQKRLFDEMHLGVVSVLFGAGLRFFEYLDIENLELQRVRALETPEVTQLVFRLRRQ